MAKKKAKKKSPKLIIFIVVLVVVLAVAAVTVYFVKPELYHIYLGFGQHTWSEWETVKENNCGVNGSRKHTCSVCGEVETEVIPATGNHTLNEEEICIVCGYDASVGKVEEIPEAELSIHFMELGNQYTGDSILIKCGDTEVLIDAGSRQNSATALKEYIDNYCTDGVLEYVISTHADQDHIAAFYGNASGSTRTGILYQYEIGTFIKFDRSDSTTGIYQNYLSAVDYIASHGTAVYTASQCYDMKDGAQRQYYLDENQTISINILYNYYYYNKSSDENNYSVVTLLTQELPDGSRLNYLFSGDLEEDGESRLVDYYANVPEAYRTEYNVLPEVVLYKAGHHGSKTSSTDKLLRVIKPEYVVVCCVAGSPEYTLADVNTFPTQTMIDNVSKYTDKIYVTSLGTGLPEVVDGKFTSKSFEGATSMNGDIVFYYRKNSSGGGKLKLWCSNNDTILKDTEWFSEHRTWNAG